jgi:hypothetical protein
MKQLAAQPKALALRTWRDEVDMRAMAIVTLITLPGTFTAVSAPCSTCPKETHTYKIKTLFSTSFFNFQPASDSAHVSSWIWLYFVVTVAFTALCLLGWYYSSRTMAEAAEGFPVDEDEQNNEKVHDTDSWTLQAQASKMHDSEDSSLSRSLPPEDRPHSKGVTKHNSHLNATPAEISNEFLNARTIEPPLNHDDPAPARAYWEATDILGTQSYGRSGRACAMCAQHIV